MTSLHFPSPLSESAAVREATAEELRVLLALSESENPDPNALANLAGVSRARAIAALAYFRAAGVLPAEADIIDEYDYYLEENRLDELPPAQMAAVVERQNLKPFLEECAALLGKPTLSATESRNLVALCAQYGLSEEYVVMLLSDVCRRPNPTVRGAVNFAIRLHGKDIRTPDALNEYLTHRDRVGDQTHIYRRVFGVYDRNLSSAERQSAARWLGEYGFDESVLSFAYDYAVDRGCVNIRAYMDKLLTAWHTAGVHSRAECETYLQANSAPAVRATGKKKDGAEKPRYGNFDPEDAFQKALARSFGEESEKKGD